MPVLYVRTFQPACVSSPTSASAFESVALAESRAWWRQTQVLFRRQLFAQVVIVRSCRSPPDRSRLALDEILAEECDRLPRLA
jgi:hypothetical protein